MLRILALVVGLSLLGADLLAQDFSVTTRVFDLDSPEPNQPVARSRTLFHVGKVYDVIDGAAEATRTRTFGTLVPFRPIRRRPRLPHSRWSAPAARRVAARIARR